jgi:hypothetical protein
LQHNFFPVKQCVSSILPFFSCGSMHSWLAI